MEAATTPLITGVDFAMLPTTDIERAIAFYTEVLELPMTSRYGRVDGAEFETGNLTIALFNFAKLGRETPPNSGPIAFQVDDVPAAQERLEARGVQFHMDLIDSGFCHQAIFSDPDGNTLILHHRYIPKEAAA
jgi:predicted enzyme related to lactoylglutathione lyase